MSLCADLCVRVKMNNGVGCLALRGMFGCVLNHGKLPYLVAHINRTLELVFG